MNQHVIAYLTHRYNRMWDYMTFLAMVPKAGGYSGKHWRAKYDQADHDQMQTLKRIELERA